jgi:hypothetical protein
MEGMRGFVVLALLAGACGVEMSGGTDGGRRDAGGNLAQVCIPGEQLTCVCAGGGQGTQRCADDGLSLESCTCPDDLGTVDLASSSDLGGAGADLTTTDLSPLMFDIALCGGENQPCCSGSCAPGAPAEADCVGSCTQSLTSCRRNSNPALPPRCAPCGVYGQHCCLGSTCSGSLTCQRFVGDTWDTCR